MKLTIIVEKNEDLLQGWVESKTWTPTPYGKTITELVDNLKELTADYLAHEGKNDKYWGKINWDKVELEIQYDLQDLFEVFSFINFTDVARRLGIHKTLLTHYKTGTRKASAEQAQRIEDVLHELGKELVSVKLVA